MRNLYYILVDGQPVAEPDFLKWGQWFEHIENRIVAKTEALPGVEVSTVFLGIDHNYSESGVPILWETMIFADDSQAVQRTEHENGDITVRRPYDHQQWRYASREAAEEHHARLVEHLKAWHPLKAEEAV